MEHRSVRLQGLFGVPASVRKGGKMKKTKNKKVETLRVPLHTYTYACTRVSLYRYTHLYIHTYIHAHTYIYIYIYIYIYLPAHVSNVGQGVFLGPPEPPKIYSQIP